MTIAAQVIPRRRNWRYSMVAYVQRMNLCDQVAVPVGYTNDGWRTIHLYFDVEAL